jgi:hypothetical protein
MKHISILFVIFFGHFLVAQNVILNKVERSHSNTDKTFYKINPAETKAEYLGEIEVQGFSDDDAEMFGKVYKKAKQIGANAFAYKPFESITGGQQKFDAAHYRLSLYYVEQADFQPETNIVYLISSPYRDQIISFNEEKIAFKPRTFIRKALVPGTVYTVSTRKFLGSSIKLSAQENQPVQYFQFSAFSVNSNPYGSSVINLKSGDITRLEQSYAQFLTTIYQSLDSLEEQQK